MKHKREYVPGISEFRTDLCSDPWGETMLWWFTVAEEIYFNRDFDVPMEWRFRPSPLGPSSYDGDLTAEVVQDLSDADLLYFGWVLHRYEGLLRRCGRDY